MKRLATLFIILLLAAVNYSSVYATVHEQPKGKEVPVLDEQASDCIETLADRLDESCFELPSHTNIQSTQQNEFPTSRRIAGNEKANSIYAALPQEQEFITSDIAGQKAVTSSRHSRGYYIYALRHIII